MQVSPITQPGDHWQISSARAIDGDTIIAQVAIGFTVSVELRIRLKEFFAPEHEGLTPGAAETAGARLQSTLDRGGLSFPRRGVRQDNHGRWVVTLHQHGQALNPHDVLGPWQLTEAAHRLDLAAARQRRRKGGASL